MKTDSINLAPMLNVYPDSMGGNLSALVDILKQSRLGDGIASIYVLPSLFHTDLDRGFSVIDYDLNDACVKIEDLEALKALGIDLKLDFILNHASVLSEQFQDILEKGEASPYKDFFINWNTFWEGNGVMTEQGYIQPHEDLIKDMFFRKKGLPILMVRFPNGENVPYWNTFYQAIKYPRLDAQDIMKHVGLQYGASQQLAERIKQSLDSGIAPQEIDFGQYDHSKPTLVAYLESHRKYLGQMDLNIHSPLVWDFYKNVLQKLAGYGAKIVRLDAFAYAPKAPGEKNFLNEPGTWDLLQDVRALADQYGLTLLPEIHSSYSDKTHEAIAGRGYMTYDFFLPGLMIDALESGQCDSLMNWANEIIDKKIQVVNMLGCHDGIPMLDLKGLLPEERIQSLIDTIVERGGMVKNLHGQKNVYYQVNATYYSALGENDSKMLMARAIQLFMPGKPQIWYLDIFLGKNNYAAVEAFGPDGHKEINRTNLSNEQVYEALENPTVQKQLDMMTFRTTFPAFSSDALIDVYKEGENMVFIWTRDGFRAELCANLKTMRFSIKGIDDTGAVVCQIN